MNGYLIAFFIIFIYLVIAIFLASRYKEPMGKLNLSFFGPLLMWRTTRGIKLIEKLARLKRFWKAYANVSIVLLFFVMFSMLFFLFVAAYSATTIEIDPMPIENVLVLPGINPIIPLWYGLFALIIAVVIHEFAHGIQARVADLKIKSLGVVFFVIPMGAFVEPDEDELRNTKKLKRDRVFAAGPATNIFFGLICVMIFSWGFMGSLEPVEDGVIIISVTEDYPADNAGLKPGMVIIYVEGNTTTGITLPGINITTKQEFSDFMELTHVNDTINLTVYWDEREMVFDNITLADRGEYYKDFSDLREEFAGQGFLGIESRGADEFMESLSHPVRSAEGDRNLARMNLFYLGLRLPLDTSIMPFHDPLTDMYEVEGPLAGMPEGMFWGLANMFYYLFWLNILVGIFNALPAVPLDGGYPYRDAWDSLLKRVFKNKDKKTREGMVGRITIYTALLILFLLLWTLFIPYL
ncbi:MAG: site-2 protease family protein [Thermoplasmata archaeon]|nr:MAG: site-2 protease family protein [Thermoplasmata archaeon]